MREVSVMKKLRHLNVVRGFALPDDIQAQIKCKLTPLAMEYCSGGSLRESCNHYRRGVPESELRNVLRDLCAGLRYLHRKHIVHRDIKPDNIVIQRAHRLIYKITDLGYIKILDPKNITRSFIGTIGYAAPEILNSSHARRYNYLVDYWSLGVTVFEVATGFRPFRDIPICSKKENAIWGRRTLRGVEYFLELPERCVFSELFGNYLNYWLRIMLHRTPAERNPDVTMSPLDSMIRFLAINEQQACRCPPADASGAAATAAAVARKVARPCHVARDAKRQTI